MVVMLGFVLFLVDPNPVPAQRTCVHLVGDGTPAARQAFPVSLPIVLRGWPWDQNWMELVGDPFSSGVSLPGDPIMSSSLVANDSGESIGIFFSIKNIHKYT